MITIILSIIFWCLGNRTLGCIAIILGIIGTVIDFMLYGWLAIIDLIILLINVIVITTRD